MQLQCLEMDLEAYVGRYSGETRLQRLLLIARTAADDDLADQAFGLAEQQMKADGNVRRYKEVFGYHHHQQQKQAEQGKCAFVELVSRLSPATMHVDNV